MNDHKVQDFDNSTTEFLSPKMETQPDAAADDGLDNDDDDCSESALSRPTSSASTQAVRPPQKRKNLKRTGGMR